MSNSLREEWAEVCDERDKLRVENARLRGELDRLFAGDDPAQTVRAENTRLMGWLALASEKQVLRCVCGAPATCIGMYERQDWPDIGCDTCCGHGNEDGWCIRIVPEEGDRTTSDKPAFRQPAPDVQAALADALEQVKAALGDRLLGNGPLSKEYAHSVMRQINAALTLAGRKP